MNYEDLTNYENNVPYPTKTKKPSKINCVTADDYRQYANELEVWEKNNVTYENDVKEWKLMQGKLNEKFKHDALDDNGILDDPRAEVIYTKAWRDSHSNGIWEVYQTIGDLVDFVQELDKAINKV